MSDFENKIESEFVKFWDEETRLFPPSTNYASVKAGYFGAAFPLRQKIAELEVLLSNQDNKTIEAWTHAEKLRNLITQYQNLTGFNIDENGNGYSGPDVYQENQELRKVLNLITNITGCFCETSEPVKVCLRCEIRSKFNLDKSDGV